MSCSGHTSRWHDDTLAQSLKCAEKQTPPFSLRPTWQRLELCWHLSSLSGLILWLCSHGVRGKAGVAMATPVDGAIQLWERRAQGGAAATHQHLYFHHPHSLKHSFSPVSILCKSATLSVTAVTSITSNSNYCYFNLGNESVINFHFLFKKKSNKQKQTKCPIFFASWYLSELVFPP